MEPKKFGRIIRERRKQEELSQEELANKIGISRNYLSQIERGQATNLSWQVMERLTAELGVQVTRDESNLPPGLPEFAVAANLPPDDIAMLAQVKLRGKQPTTPEKWELLYKVIKMTVEE